MRTTSPALSKMGDVVPYRSPHTNTRTTAYVGMVIFIAAWAMMFAALFFAYGAMRSGSETWPPMGQPTVGIGLPALNTGIIVVASIALELALLAIRRNRPRALSLGLAIATVLGIAFLAIQWFTGVELYGEGLKPSSGPYGSVLYGLAGVHALHVVAGIAPLLWLTMQSLRGRYTAPQHLPVRLWALYWHFVGIIWVLMFVVVIAL